MFNAQFSFLSQIMSHLTLIDSQQPSEVEVYLQKVLKTSTGISDKNNALSNNAKNDAINGNEETNANNALRDVS